MNVSPITLEGQYVRLEPLKQTDAEPLISAAGDGELWNSTVTIVPSRDNIAEYIGALDGQAQGASYHLCHSKVTNKVSDYALLRN